jgi:cyclophilin family peptidyl-prolyl cis-trans isomerase
LKSSNFRKGKRLWFALLVSFMILISACSKQGVNEPTPLVGNKHWETAPAMSLNDSANYEAVVNTTEGSFTIDLFEKNAPKTVNNFVFLSKEGYYNGVIFHRIIKSFMIQTGDPTGTGKGGPGYVFEDELDSPYSYEAGIVAMANLGPNTNGSQFFICTGDCSHLNDYPNYTIFGKVTAGMDSIRIIENTPVRMNPAANEGVPSFPTKKVSITSIDIVEK